MIHPSIKRKYEAIFDQFKSGISLRQIAKLNNIGCTRNLGYNLKLLYGQEYINVAHGKTIKQTNNLQYTLLPNLYTNRTETNITKKAKEIFKNYNFMEEVGVWENQTKLLAAIDLYNLEQDIAIELIYKSDNCSSKIIKKINRYKKYFKNVYVFFLVDSDAYLRQKTRYLMLSILDKNNINAQIFDVATHTPYPPCLFPMELNKTIASGV
jgi:hypothetical protein